MFAVLCTQGEMTAFQVLKECRKDKFAPILVMRNEGESVVPLFPSQKVAARFVDRNLPKEWGVTGAVQVTEQDLEFLEGKGHRFCLLNFPRKLTDIVEFDIEILEYVEAPAISTVIK